MMNFVHVKICHRLIFLLCNTYNLTLKLIISIKGKSWCSSFGAINISVIDYLSDSAKQHLVNYVMLNI